MGTYVSGIIIGVLGSILSAIVIGIVVRGTTFFWLFSSSIKMAMRLKREYITSFHLRREDYRERLPEFLSHAKHSITIISISLKLTSEEGAILELLKSKIAANPDFRIKISLINPFSAAAGALALSLNIPLEDLQVEICSMLKKLVICRDSLKEADKPRMEISIHDCIPMGSAILLDAAPEKGVIQVETKLFKSPRTESFGYEVRAPSSFYKRNYRSWMQVIDDSKPAKEVDYTWPPMPTKRVRKPKEKV